MLTLSRKWYLHTCVHVCVCRESGQWASQQSFAWLQICFTDQPHASGLGVCRSEHFPSFSRRSLWSVMISQLSPILTGVQASAPIPGRAVWVCLGLPLWDSGNVLPQRRAISMHGPDGP